MAKLKYLLTSIQDFTHKDINIRITSKFSYCQSVDNIILTSTIKSTNNETNQNTHILEIWTVRAFPMFLLHGYQYNFYVIYSYIFSQSSYRFTWDFLKIRS
jgi:hypothetical protein